MENLNKKYVMYAFVRQLPGIFIIWFVVLATFGYMGILVALAIAALSYGWSLLVYNNYKYNLEAVEFKKELGVLNKKYVSIPYGRIQNVDINRGLLERMFGLSTLKIQTAGSSAHLAAEGTVPGLTYEVAEKLRAALIQRSQGGVQTEPSSENSTTESGGM